MSVFSENLKKYRIRAGYKSAKVFAESLGLGVNQYRNYEVKGSEPKFDNLAKIADKLGITIDTLLGHTPEAFGEDWLLQIQKALRDRDIEITGQTDDTVTICIPSLEITESISKDKLTAILDDAKQHAVDNQVYDGMLHELRGTILAYALTNNLDALPPTAKETLRKFGYTDNK